MRFRSPHKNSDAPSFMQNRLFFPQAALDKWLVDGTIEIAGTELTILKEARTYKIVEAVRITREVTGERDPNDLVGRVKSCAFLEERGAELFENSMILGENAYDVVTGWVGMPTTTFGDFIVSEARKRILFDRRCGSPDSTGPNDEPKSDEDLLVRTLLEDLRP
jgi:hypothetical protein